MDIKVRIKELMEERRLTIYALAVKSDLSQACIANWYSERKYMPSIEALEKICVGLRISMAELFCDSDSEWLPVKEEKRKLFFRWDRLDAEERELIMRTIDKLIEKKQQNKNVTNNYKITSKVFI